MSATVAGSRRNHRTNNSSPALLSPEEQQQNFGRAISGPGCKPWVGHRIDNFDICGAYSLFRLFLLFLFCFLFFGFFTDTVEPELRRRRRPWAKWYMVGLQP